MIPVTRLPEPRILQEKRTTWTADFLASSKRRPDSTKYAHREVVETLRTMSHDKCFYCEAREGSLSVDHYIEVSERRDLAFEWSNLYLACDECQRKHPNRSIPVAACLDPCDPHVEPPAHLTFVAERAKAASSCGEQTIKKYRLNDSARLLQRTRQLSLWRDAFEQILQRQIADGGRAMSDAELTVLRRFADADEPFSAMFSWLMRARRLL